MSALSLLIPCYNASSYLPRLWQNIEDLTKPFDEVLIYDDGSTDDTHHVAKELGIRVIHSQQNRGPGYARNRLAEEASSPWIHFHDADDLIHPDFVKKMMVHQLDVYDVVLCHAEWIEEEYKNRQIHWKYDADSLERDPRGALLSHPSSALNVIYRKEFFSRVGGFREDIFCWEDADLNVRLACSGARFHVVDETLVTALRHDRGLSANQAMCLECRMKLLRDYAETFESKYRELIAGEVEKVAREYVAIGDRQRLLSTLSFSRELGFPLPRSKNVLFNILASLLPPAWSFVLQERMRTIPFS